MIVANGGLLLQLMDELELILADTSNEELTAEKKVQYNDVSCSCLAGIMVNALALVHHCQSLCAWLRIRKLHEDGDNGNTMDESYSNPGKVSEVSGNTVRVKKQTMPLPNCKTILL